MSNRSLARIWLISVSVPRPACHLHCSPCWGASSQGCCWERNTALLYTQLGQPFTQEWGTAKTQRPRVTSAPLCGPWARERVPCATLFLLLSIKWREKEPGLSTCSSSSETGGGGEKPGTTHWALKLCELCTCTEPSPSPRNAATLKFRHGLLRVPLTPNRTHTSNF